MPAKPEQMALDWAQEEAQAADADLTLSYTFDDGVLVCGATRQWKEAIKSTAFGGKKFRFSRRLPDDCAWYVPNTRGKFVERSGLDRTAEVLRRAGASVDVRYETPHGGPTVGDIEKRELAKRSRAEARVERHEQRARALRKKADAEFAAADLREEKSGIPFGQPILVGHHSERRHRRAIEKAWRAGERGLEATREAETRERRARAGERQIAKAGDPGAIQRKLSKLEAEARDFKRRLAGTSAKQFGPATGEHRQRIQAMLAEREAEIAYWKTELAQITGGHVWGASDFKPGDVVDGRHGWAIVLKTSPKSMTVNYVNPALRRLNPQKLTYDRVEKTLAQADPRLQAVLDAMAERIDQTPDEIAERARTFTASEVRSALSALEQMQLVYGSNDDRWTRAQWEVKRKKGAKDETLSPLQKAMAAVLFKALTREADGADYFQVPEDRVALADMVRRGYVEILRPEQHHGGARSRVGSTQADRAKLTAAGLAAIGKKAPAGVKLKGGKAAPKKNRLTWRKGGAAGIYRATPAVKKVDPSGQWQPRRELMVRKPNRAIYADTWEVVAQHVNDLNDAIFIATARSLASGKKLAEQAVESGEFELLK